MPAYLIITHTDPANVARLCGRIPQASPVYIHVDGNVGRRYGEFEQRVSQVRDAVFIQPRRRVSWSGFEMVRAEIDLLRAAHMAIDDADHLVLLSGSDYPIRPVEEFEAYLGAAAHRQHIRAFSIPDSEDRYFRQVDRLWWMDRIIPGGLADKALRKALNETAGRLVGRLRRPPNTPCHGLSWWAITGSCARFVLEEAERDPRLERFYRHVWCPDEKFVHSIVHASSFARETRSGGVETYEGPGQWRLSNFHLIHPSLTKYYTVADREEVARSDQFFVRKVRSDLSTPLLDWIDHRRLKVAA